MSHITVARTRGGIQVLRMHDDGRVEILLDGKRESNDRVMIRGDVDKLPPLLITEERAGQL